MLIQVSRHLAVLGFDLSPMTVALPLETTCRLLHHFPLTVPRTFLNGYHYVSVKRVNNPIITLTLTPNSNPTQDCLLI